MRILFIAHRIPYPPNKGDKIRSFNILRYLAKEHEVHLVTLIDDQSDARYIDTLTPIVDSIHTADVHARRRVASALRALLSGRSISQEHFYSNLLQKHVNRLLEEIDFDLVFCSSSTSADFLYRSKPGMPGLASMPKVMDFMDVDSVKWKQYAAEMSWPANVVYEREATRLAEFEKAIGQDFQKLLFVSPNEAKLFPDASVRHKVAAIRNGVDLGYFSPARDRVEPPVPTLVFVGMMDYTPNIDGMRWFIDNVFPDIRALYPDLELLVVGGRPTDEVSRWGGIDGITVTGFVDDVREYMARGTLSIVPLRIARGIQNKVLEAMASGMPIVATSFALEGIECEPGRDTVSADSAKEFVQAIASLIDAPDRARAIGAAAREFVEAHHSWEAQLAQLDELLRLPTGAKDSLSAQGSVE